MANMSKDEVWALYTECQKTNNNLLYLQEHRSNFNRDDFNKHWAMAVEEQTNACLDFADYFCREHQEEFYNLFELGDITSA